LAHGCIGFVRATVFCVSRRAPEADFSDWGIYHGCISNNRIHEINVLHTNTVILELVNGKKVAVRFMGSCRGIKQYGFVYTARNNQFCAMALSVRMMETGAHCQIGSLEPYTEPEPSGLTEEN
jgi:hypothetical protein